METPPSLDRIPRGNTCAGVNRAIIEYLLRLPREARPARFLDVPCGSGVFLATLRQFFPDAVVRGGDVQAPEPATEVARVDLSRPFALFAPLKFDVITSISGVMEFDNTRQFFETCADHLAPDGLLIVTNDNVVAIRDRLSFLFLGKVRRFRLFVGPEDPTWKLISIQNLARSLHDAGFSIREIRYLSARRKDWLLLPLAAVIWPFQWIYVRRARSKVPAARRREMFPFRALICRHYMIVCERR